MKRILAGLAVTAALIGSNLPCFALKISPGNYELKWDPKLTNNIPCDQDSYDDGLVRKLPKFISKHPIKNCIYVDGRKSRDMIIVILDESKGTNTGYDIAYIDHNRNFDLTDDKPVKMKYEDEFYQSVSDWVDIKSHQGRLSGEHTNHPLKVRYMLKTGPGFMGLQSKGGWRGKINTSSGKKDFSIIDSNSNGIFGDRIQRQSDIDNEFHLADAIVFNPDVRQCLYCAFESNQAVLLNKVCRVGKDLVTFKINAIGNKLTVARYAGKTGKIKIVADDIEGVKAEVVCGDITDKDTNFRLVKADNGEIELPEGEYTINVWIKPESSQSTIGCKLLKTVSVVADRTTKAEIEGKIAAEIIPYSGVSYADMDFHITVGDSAVITEAPYQVMAKFLDANGKVAKEISTAGMSVPGKFRRCFDIPKLSPGKYTLELSLDTKCKLGVIKAAHTLAIED